MTLNLCPVYGIEYFYEIEKCRIRTFPISLWSNISQIKNNSKIEVIVKPKEVCFLQTLHFDCVAIAIIIGINVWLIFFL